MASTFEAAISRLDGAARHTRVDPEALEVLKHPKAIL